MRRSICLIWPQLSPTRADGRWTIYGANRLAYPWPLTGSRAPRADEITSFAPFIARAIGLARPRLILAFGQHAAALAGEDRGIASLRGRWLAIGETPMLATFHPRQLLNQPELKRLAWADLQALAARITSL